MKVTVNHIELSLHQGATVLDALYAYYAIKENKRLHVLPEVTDRYGNQVAIDGALSEGSQLHITDDCLKK